MSWLNRVKDHVGSGITSSSNLGGGTVSSSTLQGGGGGGTYAVPMLSQAAKDALEKGEIMRMVQAQNSMMNPQVYATPSTRQWSNREKIHMRLNIPEGYLTGFDFLEATQLDEDKMVVFVVTNNKHCTIEDDAHLFPSDTLITQLRLLRK